MPSGGRWRPCPVTISFWRSSPFRNSGGLFRACREPVVSASVYPHLPAIEGPPARDMLWRVSRRSGPLKPPSMFRSSSGRSARAPRFHQGGRCCTWVRISPRPREAYGGSGRVSSPAGVRHVARRRPGAQPPLVLTEQAGLDAGVDRCHLSRLSQLSPGLSGVNRG